MIDDVNREFYDSLWRATRLVGPDRFNTWSTVEKLAAGDGLRLEIGAGLRPRLPLDGTVFVDASAAAVATLAKGGARAVVGDVGGLPFPDAAFALVGAFDVIEHVEDDAPVFRELARVLAPGGVLLCSVPLHEHAWTTFDEIVGHYRRYDPDAFAGRLAEHGRSHVVLYAPQGRARVRGRALPMLARWRRWIASRSAGG